MGARIGKVVKYRENLPPLSHMNFWSRDQREVKVTRQIEKPISPLSKDL